MTPGTHDEMSDAEKRDNARTPMQWDDSKQAGFTEGERGSK